jgi:glycosyltransferase involved in cell wall biosynthesis
MTLPPELLAQRRGQKADSRGLEMDNGQHEKVSVIMPFFRSAAYIRDAIESVLAQDSDVPWRLYLINDGSDQADVTIAREFCAANSGKIRLIGSPGSVHRGSSAARNLGIRSSAGSIIAFLDADDVWYPHTLRTQVALLDAHPRADMCYGSALRWCSWNGKDEDFDVSCTVDGFGVDRLVPGEAVLSTFLRDEWLTPCTGSVAIRRSAFLASGGFEEQFQGLFDDQVLYAKLCLGGQVYVTSQGLSKYRRHPDSCCSQAVARGIEPAERERFSEWLASYRKELCLSVR